MPEFADLDRELPVVRDDYVSGYLRQEQQSGLIGIYEQAGAQSVWHDGDGPDWSLENPLFDADFDRVGPWLARAFERMPVLEPLGIKQVICGAISYPPDGEPLLGPSGVPNFWQMAGVQVGIADGPGLGRELARWMVHGTTGVSVRAYDARRLGYIDRGDVMTYGRTKGTEDHQYRHQTPLPGLERPAGRPYRTTPLYGRMHGKGAVFTQVYGWERPKWFPGAAGLPSQDMVSFRHTGWFDTVAEECRAVRERGRDPRRHRVRQVRPGRPGRSRSAGPPHHQHRARHRARRPHIPADTAGPDRGRADRHPSGRRPPVPGVGRSG